MSFTRAFTSFQVSRNNYWDFISNQTREVSGKLTGVSRTFVSRTISREKKCFREKKKKDSLAKFSYEKQYFWKNRLLAFEGKNGRYTSTRSIYIYIQVWQKRKAQTLSNHRRRFSTNFSASSFPHNIRNIFLRSFRDTRGLEALISFDVKIIQRQYIYKPRERRRGKKKKKCFSFNQRLLVAAILLPRTNERRERENSAVYPACERVAIFPSAPFTVSSPRVKFPGSARPRSKPR